MKKFNVTSHSLIVTDPCYTVGTWCQGILFNVKNGEWRANTIMSKDDHVESLMVWHPSFNMELDPDWGDKLEDQDMQIGVDSGQAGFFDLDAFCRVKWEKSEASDTKAFFDGVCEIAGSPKQFGTVNFGAVACSGYGDGIYDCTVYRDNNGEITMALLEFIREELPNETPA